jgi:hypothetical protein
MYDDQITLLEKEARRKGEADDSRTRRWQDALQSIAKEVSSIMYI